MKNFLIFLWLLFFPLLGGKISAVIAGDMQGFYNLLKLPPYSPAPEVFPVAWIILYLLMGFGSWIVYQKALNQYRSPQYYLLPFAIQLALNFAWTPIFFGLPAYWGGAWLAVLLFYAVGWMIWRFYAISRLAAYLQIPYLLWCAYAAYLSFGVAVLN